MDDPPQAGDVNTGDTELRRKTLIGFAGSVHPICEKSHASNVRSSYTDGKQDFTIIGWPSCAISDQLPAMPSQAEILRMHREAKGLSLEQAAFGVELAARTRGIDPKSKKIPRTHASLSRWETGKVEIKDVGLELLAAAYGVEKDDLRKPPPPEGQAPTRTVEVPADQAAAVQAFLEAMRKAG